MGFLSYYANVPEEISPKCHSYMATMLGLVHSSFEVYGKALEAAEQSLEIAMLGALYIDRSDARQLTLGCTGFAWRNSIPKDQRKQSTASRLRWIF
jgi:hypothetical protein